MTVDLSNRQILDNGTVILDRYGLVELLYQGQTLDNCISNDLREINQFKQAKKICDNNLDEPRYIDDVVIPDIQWNQHWFTPIEYAEIDVRNWCHNLCKTDEEHQRVDLEINELEKRDMLPVLRHLIYCVDIWRKNNIFWGVGRGSSVCSFVLHLIGINRVNPLKYNLEIDEWLK